MNKRVPHQIQPEKWEVICAKVTQDVSRNAMHPELIEDYLKRRLIDKLSSELYKHLNVEITRSKNDFGEDVVTLETQIPVGPWKWALAAEKETPTVESVITGIDLNQAARIMGTTPQDIESQVRGLYKGPVKDLRKILGGRSQ